MARGPLALGDIVGIAIAVCGLVLILIAFTEWAGVRDTLTLGGEDVVRRASFPGVGSMKLTFNSTGIAGEVHNVDTFHNTNPGWIAILFGVLILVAGVGYWKFDYRSEFGILAAACGLITAAFLMKDLLDLQGALGDQAELANVDLNPGFGIYGALALALLITGLGVTGFVVERRTKSINSH